MGHYDICRIRSARLPRPSPPAAAGRGINLRACAPSSVSLSCLRLGRHTPLPVSKPLRQSLNASALFIREWLRRPQQIGSVFPSSDKLGRAMTGWLSPDPSDLVLELGPGTGSITRSLLEHGVPPERIVAIEMSQDFTELLRRRFPRIHVIQGDAQEMARLLRPHTDVTRRVGTVISSLPLKQFSAAFTRELAGKILAQLRPGGCWVQYSYDLVQRRHRGTEQFGLHGSKIVWMNLPPARVSVYQKKAA